jgi:hypothetical protein
MNSSTLRPWISAVLVSFTLPVYLALDVSSLRGWVLTTVAVLLPFVLLRVWSNSHPPTVAEVIHATEVRR